MCELFALAYIAMGVGETLNFGEVEVPLQSLGMDNIVLLTVIWAGAAIGTMAGISL